MSEYNLNYFVGVDVGTGSARAALITDSGKFVKVAQREINTWNPKQNFYEQSSEDIWKACVACVKEVVVVPAKLVNGIGFDATCSLVALNKNGEPLSVSPTGNKDQNVILWMDHRAEKEADFINSLQHPVLKYVGGKISLEMETPKLLWLKNNLKASWENADAFFDLPDFLTWKATGSSSRSLCSLVCKWTYEIREDGTAGWNESYFRDIGLGELLENDCCKIGKTVLSPGTPVGKGLNERAAKELGLVVGTPVGSSLIDAHAGGLGLIGCSAEGIHEDFQSRIALICGTSTCHMAVSKVPIFATGIWGPYFSAMVPGMWVNEGGQSATGKLLDFVIDSHPRSDEIRKKIGNTHIQQYLSEKLEKLAAAKGLSSVALLTKDFHVYPDFHGNRSPIADPTLKGMISGLGLADDEDSLALLYLATVQALAYSTRHIMETLTRAGHEFKSILICGGLTKNALFIQTHADVMNMPVLYPEEPERVLLGAAILGASASGQFKSIGEALLAMGGNGCVIRPNGDNVVGYHERKYAVYLKMLEAQREFKVIMGGRD